MAVEEITLNLSGIKVPAHASDLIAEVDRMIDQFDAADGRRRNPNYVPVDALLLYSAMAHVTDLNLPIGRVFCELGSGLGLGACFAAMLGYESYGIEIDPKLVTAARELANRRNLDPRFLCTNYFPDGYSSYPGQGGDELIAPPLVRNRYGDVIEKPCFEGMGHDTDEIDLFFVYPWPKEHEMMQDLFDSIAGDGAILIAYYGDGEICAYRKIDDAHEPSEFERDDD